MFNSRFELFSGPQLTTKATFPDSCDALDMYGTSYVCLALIFCTHVVNIHLMEIEVASYIKVKVLLLLVNRSLKSRNAIDRYTETRAEGGSRESVRKGEVLDNIREAPWDMTQQEGGQGVQMICETCQVYHDM